jgi:hypothetical protein
MGCPRSSPISSSMAAWPPEAVTAKSIRASRRCGYCQAERVSDGHRAAFSDRGSWRGGGARRPYGLAAPIVSTAAHPDRARCRIRIAHLKSTPPFWPPLALGHETGGKVSPLPRSRCSAGITVLQRRCGKAVPGFQRLWHRSQTLEDVCGRDDLADCAWLTANRRSSSRQKRKPRQSPLSSASLRHQRCVGGQPAETIRHHPTDLLMEMTSPSNEPH